MTMIRKTHELMEIEGRRQCGARNRSELIANKLAHENIITLSFPYWSLVQQEMRDWSMRDWSTADMRGPGHAGEWETAFQMYLRPHLVLTC